MRLLPAGPAERKDLEQCLDIILATEKEFGIRIDAELLAKGEYGVSLKELLNGSAMALGKGPADVALMRKADVFSGLAGIGKA